MMLKHFDICGRVEGSQVCPLGAWPALLTKNVEPGSLTLSTSKSKSISVSPFQNRFVSLSIIALIVSADYANHHQ